MNDPQQITLDEAAEILGISREAGAPQVERAYAEKLEALEKKIAQAATAALKNKYRIALERMKLARETMLNQDDGLDLPALEISEHTPITPAPTAPEPITPAPTAAPSAPPAPAKPKKPLPVKAIGIGLAALIAIAAAIFFLIPPPTAIFAGKYQKRIFYDAVVYDYSITVSKKGEITGTNQIADKTKEPVKITGKVDKDGKITATGDDKSKYIGKIQGNEMELEEQIEDADSVFFNLTKGIELPADPPQAEWAGVYHNPSIEYPAGKYEMRFEVAKNGDITALSRKLENEKGATFKGRMNTKGKITATWDLGDDKKVEYTGTVGEDEMILDETLASGTTFKIKLPKGEKTSVVVSPYAGTYRDRINYATVVFDFDITVSNDRKIKGTSHIADKSTDAVIITGTVDEDGSFTASGSDNSSYTGEFKDGEMHMEEKVKDKVFNFTLTKDGKLPTTTPQAAFAGTYTIPGTSVTATFTINDKGVLTGTKSNSSNEVWLRINGKVTTKGKVTAQGTEESSGRVFSYEGTATGTELKLVETADGKTYNLTAPKS